MVLVLNLPFGSSIIRSSFAVRVPGTFAGCISVLGLPSEGLGATRSARSKRRLALLSGISPHKSHADILKGSTLAFLRRPWQNS